MAQNFEEQINDVLLITDCLITVTYHLSAMTELKNPEFIIFANVFNFVSSSYFSVKSIVSVCMFSTSYWTVVPSQLGMS